MREPLAPSSVGARDRVNNEPMLVRLDAVEVAAATHQKALFDAPLERAVGRLDVAVLLLGADLGGARLHAEVRHHRLVLLVELARAIAEPVRGCR